MARQNIARLLVIDSQPAMQAGIRFLVEKSDKLRGVSVSPHTASTFEDGLAAAHDQHPDLVLLDVNVPQAYNKPQAINLFRSVAKLQAVVEPSAILLMYAPPAQLSSALLLLRQGLAGGLITKSDLNASRLHAAVNRALDGGSYIHYGGQDRKLADLLDGLDCFDLRPEQARLVELLAETDCVDHIAAAIHLAKPSVYRQLESLATKFGVRRWRDIPGRAARLGILDQGSVVCPVGLRKVDKVHTFLSPQGGALHLPLS